ncbi:MAG: (2Fe-2S) ferredoxin domain-containing protein [Xenococcus sp. MO_188.B8]|nr:(2Fe-2S) ferredoxin domain-containing protein [Xenococcus sp. MO_188.B8]
MIRCSVPAPEFHLVGTASKFALKKNGKVKSFELKTPKGNFCFKIPHQLHKRLNCQLYPNVKLEVKGKADICPKKAKIKLKIEQINVLSPSPSPSPFDLEFFDTASENGGILESSITAANSANSEPKGKILLCKKSSCWKRGGKAIYEKITEELREQGLEDSVTVKKTGCMGRCKSAPNLVVLPGKNRYKCFSEGEINSLIDNHFPTKCNI